MATSPSGKAAHAETKDPQMTAQPEKIAPSKEESALETEATALPEISEAATDLSEIVTPIQTTDHLEEKETLQTMIDLSVAIEMLPAATDHSVVATEIILVAEMALPLTE